MPVGAHPKSELFTVMRRSSVAGRQNTDRTSRISFRVGTVATTKSCPGASVEKSRWTATLVKENGDWKIDQQEQVDKSDQPKWFTKKEKAG